jgi:hypothetical protein
MIKLPALIGTVGFDTVQYNLDHFGSDENREPGPSGRYHMAKARTKQGQEGVDVNGIDTVGTTHTGPDSTFRPSCHFASHDHPTPKITPGTCQDFFHVDRGGRIDI